MVQATEGENNPEQESHRNQDAQVLYRAQPDQFQDDCLRKLVHGRPLEDGGDLIDEQQHQQHAGHQQPRCHHLSQNVASENLPQIQSASAVTASQPAGLLGLQGPRSGHGPTPVRT